MFKGYLSLWFQLGLEVRVTQCPLTGDIGETKPKPREETYNGKTWSGPQLVWLDVSHNTRLSRTPHQFTHSEYKLYK